MKRSSLLYTAALVILFIGIVFLLIYKFVLKETAGMEKPRIENPHEIAVEKLDGKEITFSDLIGEESGCYILFFELTNCQSCVYKGIADLESLERNGKKCIAVAIHDWPEEIAGWSRDYEFKSFAVIKKVQFYEHIHTPYLPLIAKFKKGKLTSYRYLY